MSEYLKCLHCGHEYSQPEAPKDVVRERVCPKCKSNSVRKLPPSK
jgi:predicted Zn-ribbon and HTH transcriptional regulator